MTNWHIVQTVGMRERVVGAELNRALGLLWYVPVEKTRLVVRARTLEKPFPLIIGYVFVSGLGAGAYRDVKETDGVISILDGVISAIEIDGIKRLEAEHNDALDKWRAARASGPKVGDRVRAKDGPFGSIESLLLAVRGKTATIEVPMLGSTRTATVKISDLEKVA